MDSRIFNIMQCIEIDKLKYSWNIQNYKVPPTIGWLSFLLCYLLNKEWMTVVPQKLLPTWQVSGEVMAAGCSRICQERVDEPAEVTLKHHLGKMVPG